MDPDSVEDLLRKTLEDFRMSRGERRVLSSLLTEHAPDAHGQGWLRHKAFDVARREVLGPQSAAVLDWLEEVMKLLQSYAAVETASAPTTMVYFSPSDDCPAAIQRQLKQARNTVDICVFTITDDRITESIVAAHQRRTAIRVITDNEKAEDRGSDIDRLRHAGIPVRVDRTENHMHHKFAVFDGRRTLTGSYNWTRSAARHNEENFIVTDDAGLTRQFKQEFERLWKMTDPA